MELEKRLSRFFFVQIGNEWLAEKGLTTDKKKAKALNFYEISNLPYLYEHTLHPACPEEKDFVNLAKDLDISLHLSKKQVLTILDAAKYGVSACDLYDLKSVIFSLDTQIKNLLNEGD